MSKTIRLTPEIYARLEKHSKGFDTPSNVIERLLNYFEGMPKQSLENSSSLNTTNKRDTTKYLFNNQSYGKGRLVLAIVKRYVSDNPSTSFDDLLSLFPKRVQGSIGVFNEFDAVQKKYAGKSFKRHFIKPEEVVQLSDCKIVVCTEWGIGNINEFIQKGKMAGYEIEGTNG